MANFLYNGHEFPALPELTEEEKRQYPHEYIMLMGLNGYRLYFTELPLRVNNSETYLGSAENCSAMEYSNNGTPNSFVYSKTITIGSRFFTPTQLIWTSVDVLYESDGAVYMKGTDPVPVGATFPIPEIYIPYVNTAKNIYDVQCGKTYSHIAVAENQNYISVHFLSDKFKLETYDYRTTIYTASGITFVTYDKRTETWSADVVDNMDSISEGSRYLSHWVWSDVNVVWKGKHARTNQEGWYYNSVKLPELPEIPKWNGETLLPYVVIGGPYTVEGVRGEYYSLFAVDVPPQKSGAFIQFTNPNNAMSGIHYYTTNLATTTELSEYISANFGVSGEFKAPAGVNDWGAIETTWGIVYLNLDSPIWTNTDIMDADGSVYLPASEPVHVTYVVDEGQSYDETSFKIGLTLGLCGKGVVDGLSIDGTDDTLDSESFEVGYNTGAKLRTLRQ